MFEKGIQYQLADGDDVEESSRPPACTLVAQSTYMQVMLVLLLLSCVVNIGFAVDKVTHSTTQIRPTSKYGEWLHYLEISDRADAVQPVCNTILQGHSNIRQNILQAMERGCKSSGMA